MFSETSFKQVSFSPTSWRFTAVAAAVKVLVTILRRRRR